MVMSFGYSVLGLFARKQAQFVPCVNTTGEDIRLAHGALGAAAQREGSRARRGCVLSFL